MGFQVFRFLGLGVFGVARGRPMQRLAPQDFVGAATGKDSERALASGPQQVAPDRQAGDDNQDCIILVEICGNKNQNINK